jgi:uncharacterized protein YndB with AHSA1/START domain
MSEYGAVARQGEHVMIRFERRYDAPADEVWAALTQAERLSRWLGAEVAIQPEMGGAVLLRWPGGEQMTGSILRCEPPSLLEYSWRESDAAAESVVRFEVSSAGLGTVLVLEHRRIDPAEAIGFGAGWHGHLDALGALLTGGSYDLAGSYERLGPVYAGRLAHDGTPERVTKRLTPDRPEGRRQGRAQNLVSAPCTRSPRSGGACGRTAGPAGRLGRIVKACPPP